MVQVLCPAQVSADSPRPRRIQPRLGAEAVASLVVAAIMVVVSVAVVVIVVVVVSAKRRA